MLTQPGRRTLDARAAVGELERSQRYGHRSFFFLCYGDHRDLPSFPTRRSSDLKLAEYFRDVVDSRLGAPDFAKLSNVPDGQVNRLVELGRWNFSCFDPVLLNEQ